MQRIECDTGTSLFFASQFTAQIRHLSKEKKSYFDYEEIG